MGSLLTLRGFERKREDGGGGEGILFVSLQRNGPFGNAELAN